MLSGFDDKGGSSCGVIANVFYFDIVISDFKI